MWKLYLSTKNIYDQSAPQLHNYEPTITDRHRQTKTTRDSTQQKQESRNTISPSVEWYIGTKLLIYQNKTFLTWMP